MIIIGERINATRKEIKSAIEKKDKELLQRLAKEQVNKGADYIDVNVGTGENEAENMEWMVSIIQEVITQPLVIDSASVSVLEAGLAKHKNGIPIINSVNAEKDKLATILPLAKKFDAKIIGLCMDEEGIPNEVERRIACCKKIIDKAKEIEIPLSNIYIDPLVLPISTDTTQGLVTLQVLKEIKSKFKEVNTVLGLSNISFGLPARSFINQSFLMIALYLGLDSAIIDPLDDNLMMLLKATQAILGQDEYCMDYIQAYRSRKT